MEQRRERRKGHPGGGAAGAARPEGRVSPAAGRRQRPWSPGWGRADAGAESKTGGGCGGRAGCRLGARRRDCPEPSPGHVLLSRPLLPSRKPHGLGGPACGQGLHPRRRRPSNRCGPAAGGEGAAGPRRLGWRRSPGAGARVTGAPPRSTFGLSFKPPPALVLPQTQQASLALGEGPGQHPGGEGGSAVCPALGGRGDRGPQGREGEGRRECRVMGPVGRGREARPRSRGWGLSRRDPRTPPQAAAPPGDASVSLVEAR